MTPDKVEIIAKSIERKSSASMKERILSLVHDHRIRAIEKNEIHRNEWYHIAQYLEIVYNDIKDLD